MAIMLELEPKDNNSVNDDSISRRDAIRRLASLPIEYCGLSLFMPVFLRPIDEILVQCAAGITACWYLRRGKDLAFSFDAVSRYIPTLQEITATGSTTQCKDAADLLAQCFLLKSTLAKHITNNNDAITYAQQAEVYATASGNVMLEIVALRKQDAAYYYADHWDQSLQAAEKAKHRLETTRVPLPPLLYSYVYAGLASSRACVGQKQDALSSLKKAHVAFFERQQSTDEMPPVWIDHSVENLVLNDGMTHLYLGKYQEAFDSFGQVADRYASSEAMRIEALINQVMTEVSREDKPRNMETCIDLWIPGTQGAIALQSEQWFNEVRMAYTAMRAAWPSEPRIKRLREYIVHW